jgi:hypothetical protein
MKTQLFKKATYLSLFLIWTMAACSPASDSQAINTLREFYQSYIRENSKFPVNAEQIASLKEKHCTSRLLKTLNDAELDADPFLNAQDVNAQWADNLEIAPDNSGKHLYQVCYTPSPDGPKNCVKVTMKEEGENWKIDEVAAE